MQDQPFNQIITITGPSRSGKSRWAEYLVENHPQVTYVATLQDNPSDLSLSERIRIHRQRRPPEWNLIETTSNLLANLKNIQSPSTILLDSLGGVVAAHLDLNDEEWHHLSKQLASFLLGHLGIVIIVIEEVGWSLVPNTELGIKFSDRLGVISQNFQILSSKSWLVIQGRAIDIKEISVSIPL